MAVQKLYWETLEYEHKEKSSDWYWALGIIAVSIAITAVILDNVLFAVLILLGTFLAAVFATKKPDVIRCQINDRGVLINRTFYPYRELESFWVEDSFEGGEKLILKSRKTLMPHIIIPIADISPESAREALREFLEEEEMSEPLSQKIMELFGF